MPVMKATTKGGTYLGKVFVDMVSGRIRKYRGNGGGLSPVNLVGQVVDLVCFYGCSGCRVRVDWANGWPRIHFDCD